MTELRKELLRVGTLCAAIILVFGVLIGCLMTPRNRPPAPSSPFNSPDPAHYVVLVTNTLPTPPGASPAPVLVTNKVFRTLSAVQVAQQPGKTNTNYVQMYVPPDGQNQTTNPAMMLVQSATNIGGPWKTIAQVQQISGSNVVGKILSTNRQTFYRTVSSQTPIPGH